jgi:hypothetical protein
MFEFHVYPNLTPGGGFCSIIAEPYFCEHMNDASSKGDMFCDVQVAMGQAFLRVFRFSPANHHSTNASDAGRGGYN